MKSTRLIVAVLIGAPLTLALLLVWLPLAALEWAARGLKNAVTFADNVLSKILIDPIIRNKNK